MVKHVERFVLLILLTAFATQLGHAQIAMGGTYKLDQNVIASGGGSGVDAINSLYRIDGSIAQTAAG
ncbi:MAG: hypothetical protein ABIP75_08690, partial [Pyrinomonadaceae bacterium]